MPSLDPFVPGPGVTARNWSQVPEVVEVERFGNSKSSSAKFNGLDQGKNYRKTPYLMGKSMVSCNPLINAG